MEKGCRVESLGYLHMQWMVQVEKVARRKPSRASGRPGPPWWGMRGVRAGLPGKPTKSSLLARLQQHQAAMERQVQSAVMASHLIRTYSEEAL